MNKGGYRYDCAAEWRYTRVLLAFIKKGDSKYTRGELKIALESNQYVPEYLTGKKPIPRYLPATIMMQGEDEGFCYTARNIKAWRKVSGAIDWLKEQASC